MEIYRQSINQLFNLLERERKQGNVITHAFSTDFSWPEGGERNFVFKQETAIELGPPKKESVSFLFQTGKEDRLKNGRISVIGPELGESEYKKHDFGLIILIDAELPDPWNDYRSFQNLEEIKYRVDLKGYMRRGVSQFLREWSRISREAVEAGFNLHVLGQALSREYGKLEMVRSVEVILSTDLTVVRELKAIVGKAFRFLRATHKMIDENEMDCDACEYSDICTESEDLKTIRKERLDL